jgi:Fe-S cluster assembly scaffold protein SufB
MIVSENSVITFECIQLKNGSTANIYVSTRFQKNCRGLVQLINRHGAHHTTGDMLIKTTSQDAAIATLYGMIDINSKGKNTNSFLKQDGLMLSPDAEIKSIPNLEISQNDVKASHSSAIGKLDQSALYYLTTRGITTSQAKSLLIKGFLSSLSGRIKNKLVQSFFV